MTGFDARTKLSGAIGVAGLAVLIGCGQAVAGVGQVGAGNDLASVGAEQGYSLGHAVGSQLSHAYDDVDVSALGRGFDDAINGREAALGAQQMSEAIAALETQRAQSAHDAMVAAAAANAEAGEAYRERFAQESGVTSLENGLLYKVIEPGAGDLPQQGATVTVHYRGSLVDGTEIDDSYSRGEPVEVSLDRALPGWTAALERMPQGAKWQVVVPPALAYGVTGASGIVGPNTTLVFELERVAS